MDVGVPVEGSITAQLGALDGADAIEIFEHFLDAEFRTASAPSPS